MNEFEHGYKPKDEPEYYDHTREKWDKASAIIILLIVVAMVVLAFIPGAFACEQLPKSADYVEFRDTSYWAVVAEYRELAGALKPDEELSSLPVQNVCGNHIRGFLPNGMIRVANRVRLIVAGETVLGLKALDNVCIRIKPEYIELAESITTRMIGAELCAGSISTCLIHVNEDSAAERFAPSWLDFWIIGEIHFNADLTDADVAALAVADWDGDGELEFVIPVGWTMPEPEKEEATEQQTEQEQTETQTEQQTVKKQECWKIEFDLHFLIQHCQKWFVM